MTDRGTVVMALERCKGCGLCVPVCRPGALEMTDVRNEKGYILPRLLDGCTGCRACAEVCPDFVFEVYRFGAIRDVITYTEMDEVGA